VSPYTGKSGEGIYVIGQKISKRYNVFTGF